MSDPQRARLYTRSRPGKAGFRFSQGEEPCSDERRRSEGATEVGMGAAIFGEAKTAALKPAALHSNLWGRACQADRFNCGQSKKERRCLVRGRRDGDRD
jgi:hypothetical protein